MIKIFTGTDIIEISRITSVKESLREAMIARILSLEEIEVMNLKFLQRHSIDEKWKDIARFLTKRFCAKEAFLKAIGCGVGKHCSLSDISVLNNKNGAPYISLSQKTQQKLKKFLQENRDIPITHSLSYEISISDCKNYATANAVVYSVQK